MGGVPGGVDVSRAAVGPVWGIRGRGGLFFAPVGFSLPWWAAVSLGGIRGRGGLFFAPVGFSFPWWAAVSPGGIRGRGGLLYQYFKDPLPVVGCLFGGCRGHDPRRRACLPLHPVYFPAVNFLMMAAVSIFLAS